MDAKRKPLQHNPTTAPDRGLQRATDGIVAVTGRLVVHFLYDWCLSCVGCVWGDLPNLLSLVLLVPARGCVCALTCHHYQYVMVLAGGHPFTNPQYIALQSVPKRRQSLTLSDLPSRGSITIDSAEQPVSHAFWFGAGSLFC
jgi:hypothetical protein